MIVIDIILTIIECVFRLIFWIGRKTLLFVRDHDKEFVVLAALLALLAIFGLMGYFFAIEDAAHGLITLPK